jgi:hypothetical protein
MQYRFAHVLLICLLLCSSVCIGYGRAPRRRAQSPVVEIDTGVLEGTCSPANPKLAFFRGIPIRVREVSSCARSTG